MGWNFGDILDTIEPVLPADAPAFIHGERGSPRERRDPGVQ